MSYTPLYSLNDQYYPFFNSPDPVSHQDFMRKSFSLPSFALSPFDELSCSFVPNVDAMDSSKRHSGYDRVVKELALAARVLPLYFNTLSSPVDFRPSRVRAHGTYYKHLLDFDDISPLKPPIKNDLVTLVDSMGDDLTVVNAARVSFAKTKYEMDIKDEKLIKYLATHNHWTPFSHCMIQLRIKMPIFIARQWFKHTVGFTRNEMSRRYVTDTPTFFTPSELRLSASNVKQGSSNDTLDSQASEYLMTRYKFFLRDIESLYQAFLDEGVCAEQARMILPQSTMTEFIETGSLYAYARLCKLRLDPHAQKEIRDYAEMVNDIMLKQFPISWKLLVGIELNPGPTRSGKEYLITTCKPIIELCIHCEKSISFLNSMCKNSGPTDTCTSCWLLGKSNFQHRTHPIAPRLVGIETNPGPWRWIVSITECGSFHSKLSCINKLDALAYLDMVVSETKSLQSPNRNISIKQYWYDPPAKPLVGIETNPGPTRARRMYERHPDRGHFMYRSRSGAIVFQEHPPIIPNAPPQPNTGGTFWPRKWANMTFFEELNLTLELHYIY